MSQTTDRAQTEAAPPSAGDPAVDFELLDTEGRAVMLSTLWGEKPLVLVFLRHLGCTFCRQQLAWLRRDYTKFTDLGAEVVCVAQGEPKIGKAYVIAMELPFRLLLCGYDLEVYRRYGLEVGKSSQIFNLRTIAKGLTAMLQGYKQTAVVGKGSQLGGAFIIEARLPPGTTGIVDRSGTVRYAFRSADAGDTAKNDILLAELKKL